MMRYYLLNQTVLLLLFLSFTLALTIAHLPFLTHTLWYFFTSSYLLHPIRHANTAIAPVQAFPQPCRWKHVRCPWWYVSLPPFHHLSNTLALTKFTSSPPTYPPNSILTSWLIDWMLNYLTLCSCGWSGWDAWWQWCTPRKHSRKFGGKIEAIEATRPIETSYSSYHVKGRERCGSPF